MQKNQNKKMNMCKTSSEKHAQIKTHQIDENNENDHNYEILSPYYLTGTHVDLMLLRKKCWCKLKHHLLRCI